MSDDLPETVAPALRREALLPRNVVEDSVRWPSYARWRVWLRELALATTLMAMQVADSMSTRRLPLHAPTEVTVDTIPDHGFLGIRYVSTTVSPRSTAYCRGTPASCSHSSPVITSSRINGRSRRLASEHPGEESTVRPAGSKPRS